MTPTNADLRQFILQSFSDEELDTLCFDYFPEVITEFGNGMSQNRKAMVLIGYCQRRGQTDDLRAILKRERPRAWQTSYIISEKPLADRQQEILQFTQKFINDQGRAPTMHEIGAALNVKSMTVLSYDLGKLQEAGYLERYHLESIHQTSAALPNRRTHEKTGIELIRIPAGPFKYADDYEQQIMFDLPEYWIGRTPVTNAQYKRFIDANPGQQVPFTSNGQDKPYCWDERSRTFPPHKAEHPVVLVSWDDAKAFCDWAGLILPTDEQWVKAARGTTGFRWPWGSESPTPEHANFDGNVGSTTPVGQYSPKGDSPYGCVDMFGNVQEWTMSWHIADRAPILRGISWLSNTTLAMGIAFRSYNDRSTRVRQGGFRVVELLSDPGS